jgi:hypothetical protein
MAERERDSLSTILAAWAQVVSALVGAVAAIVAGAVGIQSNQQAQKQAEEAKTIQTLQFFATFNAPNMLELRSKLGNEDWCARYGYLTSATYQSQVTPDQIVSVVDFFDALNNSCEQGLCNRDFTHALFGPYAKDFYDDVARTILDNRAGRGDDFGRGMAVLAQETAPLNEIVNHYAQGSCGVSVPTP